MRRRLVAPIAVTIVVLLAACGGDEGTESERDPTVGDGVGNAEPVCEELAQLRGSFASLGDISIEEETLPTLQETVAQIESEAASVRAEADETFGAELGTFESTLRELGGSVETVVAAPSAASIAGLVTEVADVQQAWQAVEDAAPDC